MRVNTISQVGTFDLLAIVETYVNGQNIITTKIVNKISKNNSISYTFVIFLLPHFLHIWTTTEFPWLVVFNTSSNL